ncbi:MAG: NAD-dependent epimerase/dehydratase family protein, partial [Candidatus Bathyarchaeia archaeon]
MLITGGTGFVGSHVAVKFAQEGFEVVAYDNRPRKLDYLEGWLDRITVVRGDITDLRHLMETTEGHRVDGIIYTAAMPNEEFLLANPLEGFEVNVGGTLNVLEAARVKQLRRVVYTSTGAMFGRRRNLNPIRETHPLSPSNLYSTTKRISELLMDVYHVVYGMDTVIVRLSHVYGPGLLEGDERTTY